MKIKRIVISENVEEAVSKFNLAFNQLKEILIDRQTEIDALKLAIVTGNNLMLEGLHGTAKTMIADEAFKRIEGDDLIVFKKQLMKGTQPDELFGPMISKKYRDEAIWEHNIERMLPQAHFAFIDEVYRGSDMLLPSILGILNEREFMNGITRVSCPLITAIGTTNFTTDNPELEAFHDRWLMKVKVNPLKSNTMRVKMLERFLSREHEKPKKVLLSDIQKIRRAIRTIKIDNDLLELYEEIVEEFRKTMTGTYISDRRLCLASRLMQASVVLNNPTEKEADPTHLLPTIYGIVTMGEEVKQSAYTEAASTAAEGFEQYLKENQMIRDFETYYDNSIEEWNGGNISKADATVLYDNTKKISSGLCNIDADNRPQKAINQQRLQEVSEKLQNLLREISEKLNK